MAAVDVTDATFEQDVVERSRELPVVVDFWAEWCGPCKQLEPVLEKAVGRAAPGELVLAKLDVDANPRLRVALRRAGIPAVKAFRNGHVVGEFVGAQPPSAVAAFLDGLTGPPGPSALLAELRGDGEAPRPFAAFGAGDHEGALVLLVAADRDGGGPRAAGAPARAAVAVFAELGQEHPLSLLYRRRLAAALS